MWAAHPKLNAAWLDFSAPAPQPHLAHPDARKEAYNLIKLSGAAAAAAAAAAATKNVHQSALKSSARHGDTQSQIDEPLPNETPPILSA